MNKVIPLLALLIALLVAVSAASAAPEGRDNDRPLMFYEGSFSLTQADVPSECRYSGAPLSGGKADVSVDWDTQTGRVIMEGHGDSSRLNLHCDHPDAIADTFSFLWTVDYTIDAQGDFLLSTRSFQWQGTLSGTGTTVYFDCEKNGEPAPCPPDTAGSYAFPVTITGSLSCSTKEDMIIGDIQVSNINLDTNGKWEVINDLEPDTMVAAWQTRTSVRFEAIKLNGRPMPGYCDIPLIAGDILELKFFGEDFKSIEVNLLCQEHPILRNIAQMDNWFSPGYLTLELVFNVFGDLCTPQQANGKNLAPADLHMQLKSGQVTTQVQAADLAFTYETDQLVGQSTVPSLVQVGHDDQAGQSAVRLLSGETVVSPVNSMEEILLHGAQEVAVSQGVLGPVIDLQQVSLPYVSAAP